MARAAKKPRTTLTPEQVNQIAKEGREGTPVYKLADKWKISYKRAKAIVDAELIK